MSQLMAHVPRDPTQSGNSVAEGFKERGVPSPQAQRLEVHVQGQPYYIRRHRKHLYSFGPKETEMREWVGRGFFLAVMGLHCHMRAFF